MAVESSAIIAISLLSASIRADGGAEDPISRTVPPPLLLLGGSVVVSCGKEELDEDKGEDADGEDEEGGKEMVEEGGV